MATNPSSPTSTYGSGAAMPPGGASAEVQPTDDTTPKSPTQMVLDVQENSANNVVGFLLRMKTMPKSPTERSGRSLGRFTSEKLRSPQSITHMGRLGVTFYGFKRTF